MATKKPSKPDVTLPNNFGGVKTPYTASQINNGYQEAVPQVVDGGNINYEKDGIFKYLKYLKTAIDALVDMPIGKVLTVDSSNRFEYVDKPEKPDYSSYQLTSNLEQSLSQSTTKYPSSKAVSDGLAKKQATITGGASTIASNNLTASRALVSDGSGKVAVSAVTSTELGYLDGANSNIQTQLNARAKTDLSNVSAYAKFETSWFDVEKSGLYSFTLSGDILNIPLEKRRLTLLGKVKTAQNGFQVGDIIYPQNANYIGSTSQSEMGSTSWIRGNTLGIKFGNDGAFVASSPKSPYNGIQFENIQCKLIVEGWKL